MERPGAATRPLGSPRASVDLDRVLARATARLAETTGCRRVLVWGLGADATPVLRAAQHEGGALDTPDAEEFAAALDLPGAWDLSERTTPAVLQRCGSRHGLIALAPVRRGDERASLVIGIGAASTALRPAQLAALDAAVARLAGPAASAAAADRLGRLDQEVQRLDRLAALGELSAEIVHEVRNPLVSIKTFLQLLPERSEDPEFRRSFLTLASEELRRIERLLDVVLEHARPPHESGERAAIAPAFEAVVRLVEHRAAERGVTIRTDAAVDLPATRWTEDALRQVLLNLTLNAIDATPSGETVWLRAARLGEAVEIQVDDRGSGVPAELRERIFEPFFSTRQERPGGLGLAISRRLAEERNATLQVEDAPDGGARFRLRLDPR